MGDNPWFVFEEISNTNTARTDNRTSAGLYTLAGLGQLSHMHIQSF